MRQMTNSREHGLIEPQATPLEIKQSVAPDQGSQLGSDNAWRHPLSPEATAVVQDVLTNALRHHQGGRLDEADRLYRQILDIDAHHADAVHLLGILAHQTGRDDVAVELIGKAISINRNAAVYHSNLGIALKNLGRINAAVASYGAALCIKPDYAEAYSNLGNALKDTGRLDDAVKSYCTALVIKPDYAEAHSNLGVALKDLGRINAAIASYSAALSIKPDYAEAYSNLGNALRDLGRIDAAIASHSTALRIKPDYAEAHSNLGNALMDLGCLDAAVASYSAAQRIKRDSAEAQSNLLLALNYHAKLSSEEIFAAHRRWGESCGAMARANHANNRDPTRRLRVGYVSPDFFRHSAAYFFEPLLREHDRQTFEVYCYAEVSHPDAVTERLRSLADHWRSTVGVPDGTLARQITEDKIDILVDLAGHTSKNRLPVFALKPAPLQVSWLGYPNTTGLAAIDYRLVDAITDPEGESTPSHATEQLLRLADGFLCYAPPTDAPNPAPPPSAGAGFVTFGSFNNPAKLSDATLDAWAALLRALPSARLLLKGRPFADASTRTLFQARFSDLGVVPERLTLLGHLPDPVAHLELYNKIDVALDPFPYNGTTTTCEALWMGVPVVTLAGNRHAGRVGASLLTRIGMTDLIASSTETYIDIAITLAGDTAHLMELRQNLRGRCATSTLCDAPAFARKMEATYRDLWRSYCTTSNQSAIVRRLHIGGLVPAPGWEILNAVAGEHVDHLGDATDLSRFANDSFMEIYASHVVEHFDYVTQLTEALKEWFRVMSPLGVLRISVPDMDVLAELFLDKKALTAIERFRVMRIMFGGHTDRYDFHQVGLNEDFLTHFLKSAGFVQISRVKEHGLFDDASKLLVHGRAISLNMIARKPSANKLVGAEGLEPPTFAV